MFRLSALCFVHFAARRSASSFNILSRFCVCIFVADNNRCLWLMFSHFQSLFATYFDLCGLLSCILTRITKVLLSILLFVKLFVVQIPWTTSWSCQAILLLSHFFLADCCGSTCCFAELKAEGVDDDDFDRSAEHDHEDGDDDLDGGGSVADEDDDEEMASSSASAFSSANFSADDLARLRLPKNAEAAARRADQLRAQAAKAAQQEAAAQSKSKPPKNSRVCSNCCYLMSDKTHQLREESDGKKKMRHCAVSDRCPGHSDITKCRHWRVASEGWRGANRKAHAPAWAAHIAAIATQHSNKLQIQAKKEVSKSVTLVASSSLVCARRRICTSKLRRVRASSCSACSNRIRLTSASLKFARLV